MDDSASARGAFASQDPRARPRVLLIDDNRGFAGLMELWMRPRYEFSVAPDGRRGLEAAASTKPDVVLLDIMMPGMSGLEVLRSMRADVGLSQIPVVVLTAYAEMPETAAVSAYRPWIILQKPFSPRLLLECIEAILAGAASPLSPGDEDALR